MFDKTSTRAADLICDYNSSRRKVQYTILRRGNLILHTSPLLDLILHLKLGILISSIIYLTYGTVIDSIWLQS